MKIIDFRFRPHTPDTVSGINADHPIYGDMFTLFGVPERTHAESLEGIIADLRAHDVVKTVVTGRDVETTYGVPSGNQWVLDLMHACPDMFIGYAGLDPHKGMGAVRELQTLYSEWMRGASIDPYLSHIPASHPKFYPLYSKCCELDIPIVITGGAGSRIRNAVMDDAHPRHIDTVATDFPELKIVISHGCYPFVAEAIMLVQRHKNIYMELSEYEKMPFAEAYFQAANTFLSDRILFASAHPFINIKTQIQTYASLPIDEHIRPLIMHDNAARLLKL